MKVSSMIMILMIGAAFFCVHSCGIFDEDDDNDSPATATPTMTATPQATGTATPVVISRVKKEYYLVIRQDGLFSVGYKYDNDEEPTFYDVERLWIPSVFTVGQQFDSSILRTFESSIPFVVTATDATLESPAGTFQDVVNFEYHNDYNTILEFYSVKAEVGILWHRSFSAVGHINKIYSLQDYSIYSSSDASVDKYALAVGNTWHFIIDSEGAPVFNGELTLIVTRTETINGTVIYILHSDQIMYEP